jgi:hypothetical protein
MERGSIDDCRLPIGAFIGGFGDRCIVAIDCKIRGNAAMAHSECFDAPKVNHPMNAPIGNRQSAMAPYLSVFRSTGSSR